MSSPQRPLLHPNGSTKQGLSCTWLCLDNRSWCRHVHIYTIWVWAAPGRIYTTEAFAAPRRVYVTGAWAAPGLVWTKRSLCWPWTCLHHSGLSCTWRGLCNRSLATSGYVYTKEAWAAHGLVYTTEACTASWMCHLNRGLSCTCSCRDKQNSVHEKSMNSGKF